MKRPDNEITSKDQIDREQRYMVYEYVHDNWHMERSFYGVYFLGEGEFYIKSSSYAVVLMPDPAYDDTILNGEQ